MIRSPFGFVISSCALTTGLWCSTPGRPGRIPTGSHPNPNAIFPFLQIGRYVIGFVIGAFAKIGDCRSEDFIAYLLVVDIKLRITQCSNVKRGTFGDIVPTQMNVDNKAL